MGRCPVKRSFLFGGVFGLMTIAVFFIFEPGITPLYQAIILLVVFFATIMAFLTGTLVWFIKRKAPDD